MPHKCCVPLCRGNYDPGLKVSVFSFPKNADQQRLWLSAISREDFIPTKHSKVCKLHFAEDNIIKEASVTDSRTGRTITAPLRVYRLRPDAVPTKLLPGSAEKSIINNRLRKMQASLEENTKEKLQDEVQNCTPLREQNCQQKTKDIKSVKKGSVILGKKGKPEDSDDSENLLPSLDVTSVIKEESTIEESKHDYRENKSTTLCCDAVIKQQPVEPVEEEEGSEQYMAQINFLPRNIEILSIEEPVKQEDAIDKQDIEQQCVLLPTIVEGGQTAESSVKTKERIAQSIVGGLEGHIYQVRSVLNSDVNKTVNETEDNSSECGNGYSLDTINVTYVASSPSLSLLAQNTLVHVDTSLQQCDVSSKTVNKKCYLLVHKSIRIGNRKQYQCGVCNRMFPNTDKLTQHALKHTTVNKYRCGVCNKSFERPRALSQHKLLHMSIKKYYCDGCGQVFVCESSLLLHKSLNTGSEKYQCNMCNETFTYLCSLKKHKVNHPVKTYKCGVCSKIFTNLHNLTTHETSHAVAKIYYRCDVCSKTFTKLYPLTEHKRSHTNTRNYMCDECGKTFTVLASLSQHKLIHAGVREFQCNLCDKTFTHKRYLIKHKFRHTGIKKYKCDICSKTFTQLSGLYHHKFVHTGIRRFQCNICDKMFHQKSSLKTHLKSVHMVVESLNSLKDTCSLSDRYVGRNSSNTIRLYHCDVCNRSYSNQYYFSMHKSIHTGIKNYKCSVCNRTFISYDNLSKHALLHTGLRKYQCELCNRTFVDSDALLKHKLKHDQIKKYQCGICKKFLISSDGLSRHKLAHASIKNYQCEICGKAFVQMYSMLRHKDMHSSIKKYQCEICGKTFHRLDSMSKHILRHNDTTTNSEYSQ